MKDWTKHRAKDWTEARDSVPEELREHFYWLDKIYSDAFKGDRGGYYIGGIAELIVKHGVRKPLGPDPRLDALLAIAKQLERIFSELQLVRMSGKGALDAIAEDINRIANQGDLKR